jgi:hypothetical protein
MYAGMLPVEFSQLKQLDPVVEIAELKGRTDAEVDMAQVVRRAALEGDAKAALSVLQHQHDWTAKQDTGGGGITVVVQRGVTAELTVGGVLRVGNDTDKGYQLSTTVEGELVG